MHLALGLITDFDMEISWHHWYFEESLTTGIAMKISVISTGHGLLPTFMKEGNTEYSQGLMKVRCNFPSKFTGLLNSICGS